MTSARGLGTLIAGRQETTEEPKAVTGIGMTAWMSINHCYPGVARFRLNDNVYADYTQSNFLSPQYVPHFPTPEPVSQRLALGPEARFSLGNASLLLGTKADASRSE